MVTIHPNILKRNGKKEFVVLPYEEFVMVEEEEPPPATQINVVLNWSEELKRLSAARK